MDREYEPSHTSSPTTVTTHRNTIEPGQSSRSALMRRPEHAIASGIIQQKRWHGAGTSRHAAAVQMKGGGSGTGDIHELAARGISGSATTLPFLDHIQRSFGAHDISGVEAHIAGPASQACHDIGALAYATGNHVAFRETPDLHTVAHEAAHIVQQRAGVHLVGGVGQEGDEYERHADLVADEVVAGRSAETLLMGTGQHDQSVVTQRSHVMALPAATADPLASDCDVGATKEATSTPLTESIQRKCTTSGAINSGVANCPSCAYKASKSGLVSGSPAVQREPAPGAATTPDVPAGPGAATAPGPTTAPAIHHVKVWWNTFIPMATVNGPPGSQCFAGDNRGFSNAIHASSRTHQEIEVDVASLASTINWKHVGTTHEVNCTTGAVVGTGTAPTSELTNGPIALSGSDIRIQFATAASNPLVALAPAIDSIVTFNINPISRTCSVSGQHDGFPAYEAYVTADGGAGISVYGYDPRVAGEGISALFPPMDKTITSGSMAF